MTPTLALVGAQELLFHRIRRYMIALGVTGVTNATHIERVYMPKDGTIRWYYVKPRIDSATHRCMETKPETLVMSAPIETFERLVAE